MKKRMISIVLLIALISSLVVIGGCGKKEPEVYKIGAILPLTGKIAFLGEGERNAMKLAEEHINAERVLKKKIEVLFGDSKGEPKEAVSIANKFISIDKAKIIIAATTGVANAVLPVVDKADGVLFAATIAPFIVDRSPRSFRVWPSNDQEREIDADLVKRKGWRNVGIVYVEADYGREAREALLKHLGTDFKFSFEESYPFGEKHFRSIITKLRSVSLDALFIIGYPGEFISLVPQLKEAGIKTNIIGDIGFTFDFVRKALGKAADDIIFCAPGFTLGEYTEKGKKFVKRYEELYNVVPSWNEAYSYDIILIIAEAIKRAGTDKPKELRKALLSIKNFPGATGLINIRPNGDASTALYLATIKNGEVIPYEER